jgi:hypothetical protein
MLEVPKGNILNVAEGEISESRGQGIDLTVVRNAEGSLKADVKALRFVDIGEGYFQRVVFNADHGDLLPVTVRDLPNDAQDGVIGQGFDSPQQLSEELRAGLDNLE